jgi:GAF domain
MLPLTPGTALARVAATKQTVQIADVQAEPAHRVSPAHRVGIETGGLRTLLSVPMLKQGELIGTFNLLRQEVRPFTDKQVELVSSFAPRPLSPLKTRASSTNCANRCSSRPPPPTCSRSSVARRSIFKRCSTRWSSRRHGCARRIQLSSVDRKAQPIILRRPTDTRLNMPSSSQVIRPK